MIIRKYHLHLHSISVHFTTSLYPVALFFLGLHYLAGDPSFRTTYFYMMILSTISCPFAFVTGIVEWKQKFQGKRAWIYLQKIRYGIVLTVLGSLCTVWYGLDPDVLSSERAVRGTFVVLNLCVLAVTIYLGHLGGKIAFHTPH
jgi:uncharacterized membrane protein